MISTMHYGRWLSCIAAIAMVASPVLAAGPSSNAPAPAVFDVSISSNGQLIGQVLTSAGQADANKPVVLISKRSAVAETQTDARGVFQLPVTEAGVYRISVADRSFTVRAWRAEHAPPAARESLLCVTQDAVRGQYGCAPACGVPAACGPSCGIPGACAPSCGAAAACGPCGPGAGCLGGGGGLMSILTNPVVIGLGVATAIALPLALDDDDDDNNGGNAGSGGGGSGEPTS